MPPPHPNGRAMLRNIWIEFDGEPGTDQGGLAAADNLTQREFLDMLNVVFMADGGFEAHLQTPQLVTAAPVTAAAVIAAAVTTAAAVITAVTATDERLAHGRYVLTPLIKGEQMRVSDAPFYPRTLSHARSSVARDHAFVDQVRHRDQRCVISGTLVPPVMVEAEYWVAFDVTDIVPLALDHIFPTLGISQLVSNDQQPATNTPQNGLLFSANIHQLWDSYDLAVNPNNGYRVQSFCPNSDEFHGNILDPVCRQPGDQIAVIDTLLRWHYEQAVLCNMRGVGEPFFEFDIPPGSDMIGRIMEGPQPAAQMEAELFNRLHHCQSAYDIDETSKEVSGAGEGS